MGTKTVAIDEKLYNSISDYCEENNLKIGAFCSDLLKKSFNIEKYGNIPFGTIEDIPKINQKDAPPIIENIIEPNKKEEIKTEVFSSSTMFSTTEQNIQTEQIINKKPKKRRL